MVRVFAYLLVILYTFNAGASETVVSKIELSQKSVAEMILTNSYTAKETNLTSQLSRLNLTQALSAYDWSISAESGWERSKLEAITGLHNVQDDTYKTSLLINKPLSTGTILGLDYAHTDYRSIFQATSTTTLPNGQTQNLLGVTIQQNLLKNYFGSADRMIIDAAQTTEKANQIARADSLQTIVLQGIRLFWQTYVAQQSLQDAIGSEERYKKLVQVVKRKDSLGYAAPGELAQVEAELEVRGQNVKTASANYLNLSDSLLTFLALPRNSEIKFQVDRELPPPPELVDTDIESLRSVRVLRMQMDAAEMAAKAESSKSLVDVSIVGKYYVGGIDPESSDSFSEMTGGNFPKYYIGLKVAHSFGSGNSSEAAYNKKLQAMIQSVKLERQILEKKDLLEQAKRKLVTSYQSAGSALRQKQLRNKAVQELQRAYNQGRTDISNLVDSMNKYFSSEVVYSTAVGDYQIALNEWTAMKDELVKTN